MVYKRRNYGRRKSFRRRRGGRRFGTRVRRVVRGFAERKRYLMTWATEEFDYDGHRKYLSLIAQGANEGERIGRMVTPHSFNARIQLTNIMTASAANVATWTALLVLDKQQVGDTPAAVSEILSNMGSTSAPMSMINVANKGRFKIIRRWQGTLYATTGQGNTAHLNIYHKFRKPANMRYNGTASTDIEANGLQFILISNRPGTDNACYATGVGRLWYTDV